MRRNTKSVSVSVCAAATAAALCASHVSAAEIQWKGGNANITTPSSYTLDGTDSRNFANGDIVNWGDDSDLFFDGSGFTGAFGGGNGRGRLGHNFTAYTPPTIASDYTGSAALTVDGGTISFSGNTTDAPLNAGLVIGYNASGTLTILGGIVQSREMIVVGVNDPAFPNLGTPVSTVSLS